MSAVIPHGCLEADAFAANAHAGQFRRTLPGVDPVPYIEHPRAVALLLVEAGETDRDTIRAALLHDVIEDCGVTAEELNAKFGSAVANLVVELTNDPAVPREGKTAMQMEMARRMTRQACYIKLADKITNMRDIMDAPPDWTAERKRQYYLDALDVIDAMPNLHPVLHPMFASLFARGFAAL